MALKGTKYLPKCSISSAKGKRVLCAKFHTPSCQNSLTQTDPQSSHPLSPSMQSHLSSNCRDAIHLAPASTTLGSFKGQKKLKKKASVSGILLGVQCNEEPSRLNGQDRASASTSTSTNISGHEEEVKWTDGWTNSTEWPNVKCVTTEDEGQWVILDMYDDTGKSSLKVKFSILINFIYCSLYIAVAHSSS